MPAAKKKQGRPPKDPALLQDKQVKFNAATRDYALWFLAKEYECWPTHMSDFIKWVMNQRVRDLTEKGFRIPDDPIAAAIEKGMPAKQESDEKES